MTATNPDLVQIGRVFDASFAKRATKATFIIDGERYELPMIPGCIVCPSPERIQVETAFIYLMTPRSVAEALIEDGGSSPIVVGTDLDGAMRRLSDHRQAHSPTDVRVQHKLMELSARQVGLDPDAEDFGGSMATPRGLLSLIITRVTQDVAQGRLQASVRDGLRAMQIMAQQETPEQLDQARLFRDAAERLVRILGKHCTTEQLQIIAAEVSADEKIASALAIPAQPQQLTR